ncbi:tRNA dihydrouridine(20/20a) synthase DusA [Amorphus sp. 3PC139-8]|uniref:tRNA dihydrouridine(20/20a) synthase DusA n=1 Tax=Amorphus sp. 3PC139-8 TaxID=2735676 RepID=UPI00345C8A6F
MSASGERPEASERSDTSPSDCAHRFAVAPLMDWTDRHCRVFHRRLSRRALLYTEMVTANAVVYGDRERLLGFSQEEHPVALQLGGSDPALLAEAARIGADTGYDEINLNVGCPSDRVQGGFFGACLMADPDLVARSVAAMKAAVALPVTVKCRIGIDDQDPEIALDRLADAVVAAGTDALWVHARKAWLKGLSPKENRTVPPLDYDRVYRLKARLGSLFVGINGGIDTLAAARDHLAHVDGVMLGRAAYQTPGLLAAVDRLIYGEAGPDPDPLAVAEGLLAYLDTLVAAGHRPSALTRHMLGLVHGRPGARAFRRHLTEAARAPNAGAEVLAEAIALVRAADDGARAGTLTAA